MIREKMLNFVTSGVSQTIECIRAGGRHGGRQINSKVPLMETFDLKHDPKRHHHGQQKILFILKLSYRAS